MDKRERFVTFVIAAVLAMLPALSGKLTADKAPERWTLCSLKLRNSPSEKGKVVDVVPAKASVRLKSVQTNSVIIGGVAGKWSRVVYQGKTGWVFGGWLTDKPIKGELLFKFNAALGSVVWHQGIKSAACSSEAQIYFDESGAGLFYQCDSKKKFYCAVKYIIKNDDHHHVKCNPLTPAEKMKFSFLGNRAELTGARSGGSLDLTISANYTGPDSVRCSGSLITAEGLGEFACSH